MTFDESFDYDSAGPEERFAYREWMAERQELDEEEQWYEDHSDEFVPCQNQAEMRRQIMAAAKLPPVILGA